MVLEHSRHEREDTPRHDSLTEVERNWLQQNRSREAEHWNPAYRYAINILDRNRTLGLRRQKCGKQKEEREAKFSHPQMLYETGEIVKASGFTLTGMMI